MKSNKRLLIMLPILLVAAWLAVFGDKTPQGGVAEPTRVAQEAAPAAAPAAVRENAQTEDSPPSVSTGGVLRVASREVVRKAINAEDMHDLFAAKQPPPPPPPPSAQQNAAPPPPVMPFSFIGREFLDGSWRYFLEKNGQTYVIARGEQADGFLLDSENDKEIGLVDVSSSARFVITVDAQK